jgi:iron-sulfur cluster assembly protein
VLTVLTLTDGAAETIRVLTSQPGVPADTGLRMSVPAGSDGRLTLSLEPPQPDDAVIEDGGARVFVEPDAVAVIGDRQLDGELNEQGEASFVLAGPAEV